MDCGDSVGGRSLKDSVPRDLLVKLASEELWQTAALWEHNLHRVTIPPTPTRPGKALAFPQV